MNSSPTFLAIDAGNTSIKIGVFKNDKLSETQIISSRNIDAIPDVIEKYQPFTCALSSVLSDEETFEIISYIDNILYITHETPTPLKSEYETPHTLGMDRKCNALGAYSLMKSEYAVAIDVGTCIKFDAVSATCVYLGGSISPGIHLRYKSLNDYTGKLPLLNELSTEKFVGKSTKESIQSGVLKGIEDEINGFIQRYEEEFDSLTFFMTGGDCNHFDIHSKNDIFAIENLTLYGIYEIFKYNA